MLNPEDQQRNDDATLVRRCFEFVKFKFAGWATAVNEARKSWLESQRARLEYRQELRALKQREKRPGGYREFVFMFLDYNPTNAESGEEDSPSLMSALLQWSHRVIWTRRIELGGFLFLAIVGLICYSAIRAPESNRPSDDSSFEIVELPQTPVSD